MNFEETVAAITGNNLVKLEQLLNSGVNPDLNDNNGVSLLFHAINFGSVDAVKLLLEHGAEINQTNSRGRTPWLMAVESSDYKKIVLLRGRGADTMAQNDLGQTGLHYAAMRGDEALFNELLEHAGDEVLYADHWGNTVLHLAASWDNPALVKTILTKTAIPIDAQNRDGETALLQAVRARQTAIAETLINAGCNINLASGCRNYPLLALVRAFKDDYRKLPLLCKKIGKDQKSGIEFLVAGLTDNGGCAEEPDDANCLPPLLRSDKFYKASKGCRSTIAVTRFSEQEIPGLRLCRILLDKGSMVNDADAGGDSPLLLSAGAGHEPFVQYLTANGANINARNKKGETPLLAAIRADYYAIAKLLLDIGADWKIADKNDETPKEIATKQQSLFLFEPKHQGGEDTSVLDAIRNILAKSKGVGTMSYKEMQKSIRH